MTRGWQMTAPDAATVFADPEAESTYSTQPTDLWRNHTTE